jgi:hypothetical protein
MVMKKLGLFVGAALAAAAVSLAGPAAAAAGGAVGGLDTSDPTMPVTVTTAAPAVMSALSTGGSAATADANAGPGGAGSSRPASSVCTQDVNNSGDGATVNTAGTQSAYSRMATDGVISKTEMAVPQFKVQAAALAVPSS